MEQRKLSRKEELELAETAEWVQAVSKSGALSSGPKGQLYVVDFKNRKLVTKKDLTQNK